MKLPPEFFTPAFWHTRSKEWRRPVTPDTATGICRQCRDVLGEDYYWAICAFMDRYRPNNIKPDQYFFPVYDGSRLLRAELCDKIANDMEKLQNETSGTSSSTQTTS